jgi:polyhydroxyalkanoate synthesis regulator phasin
MSTNPDEDDEEEKVVDIGAATRRAWYAGRAEGAAAGSGLESAAFRAVPTGKHGGSQTVKPEDTIGSLTVCGACGGPFNHDWPGKALGAPHPKENSMSTPDSSTPPPRIERRQLRGFHADLVDVILTAVNQYQVQYQLRGTKLLLFPPDGTSPLTVNAANSDRQRRRVSQWFVKHCVPEGTPIKRAKTSPTKVDAETVKELAEAVNSEEHLQKLNDQAKAEEPVVEPVKEPAKKAAAKKTATVVEDTHPAPSDDEWMPYYKGKGRYSTGTKSERYVINAAGQVKCLECEGQPIIGNARSTGGHTRTSHTDTTTLWGPVAKEKGTRTYFTNKAKGQVEEAIGLLQVAMGIEPPAADTTALEAQRDKLESEKHVLQTENAALKAEVGELKSEITDLKQKLADMEAKMQLFRETLSL